MCAQGAVATVDRVGSDSTLPAAAVKARVLVRVQDGRFDQLARTVPAGGGVAVDPTVAVSEVTVDASPAVTDGRGEAGPSTAPGRPLLGPGAEEPSENPVESQPEPVEGLWRVLKEVQIEDRLGVRQIVLLEVVVQSATGRAKVRDAGRHRDAGARHHHNLGARGEQRRRGSAGGSPAGRLGGGDAERRAS